MIDYNIIVILIYSVMYRVYWGKLQKIAQLTYLDIKPRVGYIPKKDADAFKKKYVKFTYMEKTQGRYLIEITAIKFSDEDIANMTK